MLHHVTLPFGKLSYNFHVSQLLFELVLSFTYSFIGMGGTIIHCKSSFDLVNCFHLYYIGGLGYMVPPYTVFNAFQRVPTWIVWWMLRFFVIRFKIPGPLKTVYQRPPLYCYCLNAILEWNELTALHKIQQYCTVQYCISKYPSTITGSAVFVFHGEPVACLLHWSGNLRLTQASSRM